jgi:hypothetical protein
MKRWVWKFPLTNNNIEGIPAMDSVGKIIEDQSDQFITDHMDMMVTDIVIVPNPETLLSVVAVCEEADSYPTPKGRTIGSIIIPEM